MKILIFAMKNLDDFLYEFLLQSWSFYGGCRNSLTGVAIS